MRIMLTGDVVGKPGRKAFQKYTAQLKATDLHQLEYLYQKKLLYQPLD